MTLDDCPIPDSDPPINRAQRALVWRIFFAAWAVALYLIWS